MSIHFRDLTSPQIEAAAKSDTLLLLPLGQTEEHGRHLPVGTDTIIAQRVCEETALQLQSAVPALVLPPVEYGYSSLTMTKWSGTFTLPQRLVIELLVEACKSLIAMGFRRIIIVNAHGHHTHAAVVAAREIADVTGVDAAVVAPHNLIAGDFAEIRKSAPGGACHGGEYETSLMMHFGYQVDLSLTDSSDALRQSSRFAGNDLFAGGRVFWSTWARQASRAGIYGDPTVASAETGRKVFEAVVREMVAFCREYHGFRGATE